MPVNQKKTSIISKRQRSIFEFTHTGDNVEVQNNFSPCEVIDLTDDVESFAVKLEEEEEINSEGKVEIREEKESDVEEVKCPMCNHSLVDFTMDDRILHIEECLSLVTLKENAPTVKTETSDVKKEETNGTTRKSESNLPKIKRKNGHLLHPDKEKEKYVNKKAKIEDSKPKVIKPPASISASRSKAEIPGVKVLTFLASENSNYQIAVDAFNYSPHESINKYFLTHFHSDHYGGITKKWCYERVFKDDDDFDNNSKYKKIIFCSVITAKLLTLRFSIDPRFIMPLELNKKYLIQSFDTDNETENNFTHADDMIPGLFVTPITANHCPGSVIFLFESLSNNGRRLKVLHCGDFRVNREILDHPTLLPFNIANNDSLCLDKVYLDTTYMSPAYNFPKQELVCKTVSDMFYNLIYSQGYAENSDSLFTTWFGVLKQSRITDFITKRDPEYKKKKFLILIGTYVIGKERLAISILKKLGNCPIYVLNINSRNDKVDLVKSFDDHYLNQVLSEDDLGRSDAECMIHLVPMKIVSSIEELSNYFNHNRYFEKFERCVGLRPTGWSFLNKYASVSRYESKDEEEANDNSNSKNGPDINCFSSFCHDLVEIMQTQPAFSFIEHILPQAPMLSLISKSKKANHDESLYRIYTLPYSEHSSFRELSFFAIFLKIKEIIPTVNINNETSIIQMGNIIKTWELMREYKTTHSCIQELESDVAQRIQDLNIDEF